MIGPRPLDCEEEHVSMKQGRYRLGSTYASVLVDVERGNLLTRVGEITLRSERGRLLVQDEDITMRGVGIRREGTFQDIQHDVHQRSLSTHLHKR